MKYKSFSDLHRANSTCMICYSLLVIILVACYLIEVIKGSRSIAYFAVFTALAVVPYIICQILFQKQKESETLKYLIAAGFGIFYLFVIFTTISPVAYVYAIMLAVSLLCYNNNKLIFWYMTAATIGNIIQVAFLGINHEISSSDLPNVEIRIFSLILFTLFLTVSTMVSNAINKSHLAATNQEKERTSELMNHILEVADQMSDYIEEVSEKMNELSETATKTTNSMQEVNQGTVDTVDSIQMQMEKTTEIQQAIQQVESSSDSITENISATKEEIHNSKANIDALIHHVALSNQANASVSKELSELSSYTDQMHSIIELINNVTTQTSLLSLNASIEAARAGEAGRGFAVVASEISNLATQTNDATVSITELINSISKELSEVVEVIEEMIENAKEQNAAANSTAQSFTNITKKADQVYEEATKLDELINGLTSANEQVIQGIETISAATEEVTAHSSETLETSERNSDITTKTSEIVTSLSQLAEELKALEH